MRHASQWSTSPWYSTFSKKGSKDSKSSPFGVRPIRQIRSSTKEPCTRRWGPAGTRPDVSQNDTTVAFRWVYVAGSSLTSSQTDLHRRMMPNTACSLSQNLQVVARRSKFQSHSPPNATKKTTDSMLLQTILSARGIHFSAQKTSPR